MISTEQQIASSVLKLGGVPEDYKEVHEFFDQTAQKVNHPEHYLLLHNAWGIFLCEEVFGPIIINSQGREISVRDLGESHVLKDLGKIPTVTEFTSRLQRAPWMGKKTVKLYNQQNANTHNSGTSTS